MVLNSETLNHRYNDDLLLDETSRCHALVEFPNVFHVLDNKPLRLAFASLDRDAGRAKTKSLRAGSWAVALGLLSLMSASAEQLWRSFTEPWPSGIAVGSALFGLAAAMIAAIGVLYGSEKDLWLQLRFRTERLRQYHFQSFIWNFSQIVESCKANAPKARARFIKHRDEATKAFIHRMAGHVDAEVATVIGAAGGQYQWLYDVENPALPTVSDGFSSNELFAAYRRLRFEEQLGYAEHKLQHSNAIFMPRRAVPLRNQQQILRIIWVVVFSFLVILHAALIVGHIIGAHGLDGPLVHVVIVWLALVALGVRTIEEGRGLSHEIERYEDYRAEVADALQRFDSALTAELRLQAMIEMERISFDEMRSFLRMVRKASFIL